MFEYIKEYLKTKDVEYKENKALSEVSPIRIGNKAKLIILPRNITDFVEILGFFDKENTDYKVLGNMSNVLAPDEEYEKVIIKTDRLSKICFQKDRVLCECGTKIPALSNRFSENGISGLEELSGIPGQLGGSVVGNAGAFGREISDLISECWVYEKASGDVFNITTSELGFSYRNSNITQNGLVILSVMLNFSESDVSTVKNNTEKYKEQRMLSQPIGDKSLGSFFKRPYPGISAGKLIDECGLRGFFIGDAEISAKHAGFIVNRGFATSEDVKELAMFAKQAVKDKFGIELCREVEYL